MYIQYNLRLSLNTVTILSSIVPLYLFYLFVKRVYSLLFEIPSVPQLDEDKWWTSDESTKEDDSIRPFKIDVRDEVLQDLQLRLKRTRPFTPPLENAHQQYGMNANLLNDIVEFWKTKYDWRVREKYLNQYPQFVTNIQGLDIHFIHVKPSADSDVEVLPLLLLHGWPGSIREFYQTIPYLTSEKKDCKFVFEVIAPSLPGYGFSQAPTKPGLCTGYMAVMFNNLMKRLGHEKYYVQGGDWGSVIVTNMSILYPNNVLGVHVNMTIVNTRYTRLLLFVGRFFPRLIIDAKNQSRIYPLGKRVRLLYLETGYLHIQATKPDTIGAALNDSPAGLAAYILEKFSTWTNVGYKRRDDGGLTQKFSYIDLLDIVMLYWVTRSITTSMRLYAETFSAAHERFNFNKLPVTVPSACARFGTDIFIQPDVIIRHKYRKLVQLTDTITGGHFAAFEEPQMFADDVWRAVKKFQAYHSADGQ